MLKQCGDDLTRENVMKQAASLKDFELGGLLPGIKINTSATDFAPISQLQMMKFKGETWELFGEITERRRRRLDAATVHLLPKDAAPARRRRGGFLL